MWKIENKRTKGHTMATLTQGALHSHPHTEQTDPDKAWGSAYHHKTYKPGAPEDTTLVCIQQTPRESKEREKVRAWNVSISHYIIDRKTDPCPQNTKTPN